MWLPFDSQVSAGAITFLLLAPLGALHGQTVLEGNILDEETGEGIGGAQVELLDSNGKLVAGLIANDKGWFHFSAIGLGNFRLRVGRIGYRQVTTPTVSLLPDDTIAVEVRLATDAVLLAPVEVVAGKHRPWVVPRMEGFYRRHDQGLGGTFITRDEIEFRNPANVSDLVRQAGASVIGSFATGGILLMSRTQCAPMIYIDGVAVTHYETSPMDSRDTPGRRAYEAVNMVDPSSIT